MEDTNHKETLSVLTAMENNMAESSLENLTHITESLLSIEESFHSSMENMRGEVSQNLNSLNAEISSNLSQHHNNVTEHFAQLDTHIKNQYESLTSTVNNYDVIQQEAMNGLMELLDQRLREVFQYVSNGKKKLASALLTKGVSIKEDATFDEIYHGILNIPQELLIGVEKVPGIISYDYHFHEGNATDGGGCYTIPDVHKHTESCYVTCRIVESGCHSTGNYNDNGSLPCRRTPV